MKKTIALLLVLVLGVTLLAGCGNDSGKSDSNKPAGNAQTSNSQDNSNNSGSGSSEATGGLSGKYLRTDNDNYFEFFPDGTCVLYNKFVDFKMDGKYSVSGNTITFAEGSEFDYDEAATIDGDTIEWLGDVYKKE